MLTLVDLPEEILIIIIKQLDIKSVYNLYKTCRTLNNIILMQGVIRICNLSCNTLATPKSLQLDMIKNIAGHLYELNVCAVLNLRKSVLLPALKKMKCLKTLDVSYTEITIVDMLDLYKNCSTIKNITINISNDLKLIGTTLHNCQEVFKNFINVHFVLKTKLSSLPLQILRKSSLDTLKFTLCDTGGTLKREEIEMTCPFKHLCMFMLNVHGAPLNGSQGSWNKIVPVVNMENIEYIILEYNTTYSVCSSPQFIHFFSENFKTTLLFTFDKNREFYGTVTIFVWDKKNTIFDDFFYFILKQRIKKILAYELLVTGDETLPLSIDTSYCDWFHIHQFEIKKNKSTDTEPNFKKPRIVRSEQILDYDKIFSKYESIRLNVHIPDSVNVTLSSSNFLSKLTYLNLAGPYVRYTNEFFNVIFRGCKKLITLNIESSSLSSCWSSIIRSIPLSQTLKNIRLVDKRIDFKTLFSSFTQCRTLENICIIDTSSDLNEMANLAPLYHQCINLYSLHIQAVVKKSTVAKMNNMHKTLLKDKPDHHVNFILEYTSSFDPINLFDHNPYLNVFDVDPIKPV